MSSPLHQGNQGSNLKETARKRSRSSSFDTCGVVHNASLDMVHTTTRKPSYSSSSSHQNNPTSQQLAIELANLKTELSKIQSLRSLDKIKAENMEKRLKRHILSLEEDAKESSALAEEIREQSETALEEMSSARCSAMNEAREWQERYIMLKEGVSVTGGSTDHVEELQEDLKVAKKGNELLQRKIQSMEAEIAALRDHSGDDSLLLMSPLREKKVQETADSPACRAPPAVLSELNRTRVKLADSERLNRQLKRKVDDLQIQADKYVKFREQAQNAESKVDKLERDLKVIRRERERLRLVEGRWSDFRKELLKHNISTDLAQCAVIQQSGDRSDDENVPPEISTVLRQFRLLSANVQEAENRMKANDSNLEISRRRVQALEGQIEEQSSEIKKIKEEKSNLTDQCRRAEQDLKIIQAQERVWKREANSMRSLLDTYKQQMDQGIIFGKNDATKDDTTSQSSSATDNDPSLRGLKLSLSSARDEIEILKKQFDAAKGDKEKAEDQTRTLQEEHDRVRNKFEKLREALYEERKKAEKAEDRAFQAEIMAGKGAFNAATTRVVHLEKNPLSAAQQEKYTNEIKALKEELTALNNSKLKASNKSSAKGKSQELDAQKFNKRLKESFREQIALFREGVYLLTGFKIDMIADVDRPRFKVRSMYAEKESDVLEFMWPEVKNGVAPDSLDLLNTEMAELLSKDSTCFMYMERYNSVPAFMASVCLSLFDKQTMISG